MVECFIDVYCKLFIADLLKAPSSDDEGIFLLPNGSRFRKVQLYGVAVQVIEKESHLHATVEDGTGRIDVYLWNIELGSPLRLGDTLMVLGTLKTLHEKRIVSSHTARHTTPLEEMVHRAEALRLREHVYTKNTMHIHRSLPFKNASAAVEQVLQLIMIRGLSSFSREQADTIIPQELQQQLDEYFQSSRHGQSPVQTILNIMQNTGELFTTNDRLHVTSMNDQLLRTTLAQVRSLCVDDPNLRETGVSIWQLEKKVPSVEQSVVRRCVFVLEERGDIYSVQNGRYLPTEL